MADELLCNVLNGKDSKKSNIFEFSHEERCTVVHLPLILGPMINYRKISYRQEQLTQFVHSSYVQHGCYA